MWVWGLNSGCQPWLQSPLPSELSLWAQTDFLFKRKRQSVIWCLQTITNSFIYLILCHPTLPCDLSRIPFSPLQGWDSLNSWKIKVYSWTYVFSLEKHNFSVNKFKKCTPSCSKHSIYSFLHFIYVLLSQKEASTKEFRGKDLWEEWLIPWGHFVEFRRI